MLTHFMMIIGYLNIFFFKLLTDFFFFCSFKKIKSFPLNSGKYLNLNPLLNLSLIYLLLYK